MSVSTAAISGCRDAHARLWTSVEGLSDAQMREPSLLPDWTLGHVLTHLARNADSVMRRLDGARRGEIVDQYPGGLEGRAAAIEEGASREAAAILEDLAATSRLLDEQFATLEPEAWDRLPRNVAGEELPARTMVWTRWREIEVHRVDLGLGYQPSEWPEEFVAQALNEELCHLPGRTDRRALLAWLFGRGDAPVLGPY